MNANILSFMMVVAFMAAALIGSSCTVSRQCKVPMSVEFIPDEGAWSGMFFSSEYVVEEYEFDEGYCLLYTDPDSNMEETEIFVDLETFQMVVDAIESGSDLIGTLVLNDDYSVKGMPVFTYMPNPEFEMANASAKCK